MKKAIETTTPLHIKIVDSVIFFSVLGLIVYIQKVSFDLHHNAIAKSLVFFFELLLAKVISIATGILSDQVWRRYVFAISYATILIYLLTTPRS